MTVFKAPLRDAPFDIWGGGGARVFVACKLFFLPPVENKFFFLAINVRQFFFRPRIFLSYVFPIMYVTIWCFFGQHIFHQFRQQTFFSVHIFNKLFFLIFVATNYFFNFILAPPPPPQISNGAFLKFRNFKEHSKTLTCFLIQWVK